MKRYVMCHAARHFWFDLADRMEAEGIATPVLWSGDARLDPEARARFPGCEIAPFGRLTVGVVEPAPAYTGAHAGFWQSDAYLRAKDRGGKMIDRIDRTLSARSVTRTVYLDRLCALLLDAFARTRPDFVLFSDTPHAPWSYALYEVAVYLGIPTYCFALWANAPLLSLRAGISGPFVPAEGIAVPEALRDELDADILRLADGFISGAQTEPRYMTNQRKRNFGIMRAMTRVRPVPARGQGPRPRDFNGVPLSPDRTRARRALWRDADNIFRHDRFASLSRVHHLTVMLSRLRRLIAVEAGLGGDVPNGRFVYFPLHYEPERTTNPDGGDFHDQFAALAALRAILPDDVTIAVKEHPSMFLLNRTGYRGRSPAFYEAVGAIANTRLVGSGIASVRLLEKCSAVATITGTVALEAALTGKRALVFGSSWHDGCPNLHPYRPDIDGRALFSPAEPAQVVKDWLVATARTRAVPGTTGPSNEAYFRSYYAREGFAAAELGAVTRLVARAVGAGGAAAG